MSNEIDARGLACPQPVIAVKKALDGLASGVVTAIVDNAVAKENVVKFAVAKNCGVSIEEQNGHYYIRITKGGPAAGASEAPADAGQTVYLITKDTLGHGSPELGAILMKAFLFTLLESGTLPKAIMFINAGVQLAVAGSPVLDHLKGLSAKGVTILSCGTCLDYFGVKDGLAVGEITNMYTIIAEVDQAAKAVTL
jgi:selenium metabolism protein YedF